MLQTAVERLWPLSEHYEYAAELGLALRNLAPGWWREFDNAVPAARYPLPQARGFAFLRWLENSELSNDELAEVIVTALQGAEPALRIELQASLDCLGRSYVSEGDPFAAPELSGQPVALYSPAACVGYPNGESLTLDEWTRTALAGADVLDFESEPADVGELARAHSRFYLQGLFAFADAGGGLLTPETCVTEDAQRSARAAAGAVIDATGRALAGERKRVPLCLVRPGSHHAERARAGGTCLINNLAVAAHYALRHGANSVAIVDLDAHHGNGTEDIFREDPRVFTLSLHQAGEFFPGTGSHDETGRGEGFGHNLNMPVSPVDDWLETLELGLTRLQRQRPQLILVEFSTDAHRADPVSDLHLSDGDFEQAVHLLESLGAPVVYELGASLSERAWVGGVRALVEASASHR